MSGNIKAIINGKVLIGQEFVKTNIYISKGTIVDFDDKLQKGIDEIIDAKNKMVLPGFIDIHTHGANGIDVNHATVRELIELSNYLTSRGVTSYLPTLLTDQHETMCNILKRVNQAKSKQETGANILGVHMEGPFLDKNYKGAMPENLIQDSSISRLKEYEEASGNNIKYMTVAVTNKNIEELIRYANEKKITVSLGHTGGDYNSCMRCISAGAKSVTHLFNAMEGLHQHRPSIIGAALESDIYTEVISDGFHLHPAIIRLVIKVKGVNRVIGVTDSMMAAGLGDGKYKLGINEVIVKDSDASLIDGSRAGSTLTMDRALKNLVKFSGLAVEDCVKMITINPAKLIGVDDKKGELTVGKDADIVIIDDDFNIVTTMVNGRQMYKAIN